MSRVIVIGSINMDVLATAERLPKPSETVMGSSVKFMPGGKGANQAVAASRAGSQVRMVGAVGSDESASALRTFLRADDIDVSLVKNVQGPSGTSLITVDAHGENIITFVAGANYTVDVDTIKSLKFAKGDVLLLQNEVPKSTIHAAARTARAASATVLYNPAPFKPLSPELLGNIDYLIVNEVEFVEFAHPEQALMTPEYFEQELKSGLPQPKNIVITVGADGLIARINNQTSRLLGYKVKAIDTTGAGDCFCGAFGAALARGSDANMALQFANAAAALSVTRLGGGPSMPHQDEIEQFIKEPKKSLSWLREDPTKAI